MEISPKHRELVLINDFSWQQPQASLKCDYGVWDEGHNFDSTNRHQLIAKFDRRGFCFFWQHHLGMLLPAARSLREKEALAAENRRDRKLTLLGLWIAACALAAEVILKLIELANK